MRSNLQNNDKNHRTVSLLLGIIFCGNIGEKERIEWTIFYVLMA
jgi:hypothetical protein